MLELPLISFANVVDEVDFFFELFAVLFSYSSQVIFPDINRIIRIIIPLVLVYSLHLAITWFPLTNLSSNLTLLFLFFLFHL